MLNFLLQLEQGKIKRNYFFIYLALIFAGVFLRIANASAAETVGQNVALGTSYTFSLAPSISDCSDAGDSIQLTDGYTLPQGNYPRGTFFTQDSSVSWNGQQEITIDLGEDKPLEGVAVNMGAGMSGNTFVPWPLIIQMLVSEDNVTWEAVGNLVELDLVNAPFQVQPDVPYASITHQYKTMTLATHGRYMKLVFGSASYKYADEIEIYRGPDANLALPYASPGITDVPTYFKSAIVPTKLRTRLAIDSQRIKQAITTANLAANISDPLHASLDAINQQLPSLTTIASPTTFKTIFPINDMHRQIFAVQAGLWRALGLTDIVAWKSGRYDPLSPTEVPTQNTAEMNVAMMSNEYRADVINLSNTKASATDLTSTIEGLPGGDNPDYVTVHEVPFTDTSNLVPVAAALPIITKQNGQYVVTVPAGLTKQIWLEFHPTEVLAGTYQGRLKVTGAGITTFTVPLNLEIYPLTFPAKPTLHLGGWDFSNPTTGFGGWNMGLTANNRQALIAKLQTHYVDTTWAATAALPGHVSGLVLSAGSYDSSGHLITPPDPAAFDAWVAEWPAASHYFAILDISLTPTSSNFSVGFPVGSTEFNTAMREWATWWVSHLQSQNIPPSKVGLLFSSETHTADIAALHIAYGEAIRSAGTELKIFEDPILPFFAPSSVPDPRLFEIADILSVQTNIFLDNNAEYKEFYAQQQAAGRELWFYSAQGPRPLRDPYLYDQVPGWLAWQYGAKGIEAWAYTDFGYPPIPNYPRSCWNDYAGVTNYSPLFIDTVSVTDGKHMEASREAVEDYEYLKMLQDKISFLEVLGIKDSAIDSAKILLATGVTRVTDGRKSSAKDLWHITKDRSVADQVRVEILESLTQLNSIKLPDPSASVFANDALKVANKKVTFGQAKKINTKSKTLTFKGSNSLIANGSVQLYRGGTLIQTVSADATGTWNIKLKEKKDTTVTFYLRYLDGAGTELGTSAGYKIKIDTQKPKITNLPIFLTKTKGAKIWWEAKDNIKVTSYKISFLGKTKTTKSKAFTVPLDSPSGLHLLSLKAYDAMGNSTSRLVTVRVR
jgi:hypothetical protein